MRRLWVFVGLVFVCAASAPAAGAQTTTTEPPAHAITGRLLDGTGRPLPGAPVVINENRGVAAAIFGGVAAAMTLGLSCAAGVDPCRRSGSVGSHTDAAGRFTFSAADVDAARKTSHGVLLLAGESDTQGSVKVKIDPTASGDVGDLRLWNASVRLTTGKEGTRIQWDAPAGADSRTELHGALLSGAEARPTTRGDVSLLTFEDKGLHGDETIDPRSIEDLTASIRLTAGFSRSRANQNARADWLAAPVAFAAAGAPLSRGATCTITPGAVSASACGLTDGDLVTAVVRTCDDPNPTCRAAPVVATVDLGKPVRMGLVAARIRAEKASVSTDGTRWVALDPLPSKENWPAALWSVDGSWRYVRVEGAGANSVDLAELSVWPPGSPKATTGDASASTAVASPSGEDSTGGDHGGGTNFWLIVVAAVLLAGGVGAAGVALGRRQSARLT